MRYRKGTALLIATALIASISITGCGKKDSAAVRVFGSTTMEPLTSKLALLYGEKSGVEIKISANGSHTGISALIDGRCDIAESSTRITEAELASAGQGACDTRVCNRQGNDRSDRASDQSAAHYIA